MYSFNVTTKRNKIRYLLICYRYFDSQIFSYIYVLKYKDVMFHIISEDRVKSNLFFFSVPHKLTRVRRTFYEKKKLILKALINLIIFRIVICVY
jgi:hypothetical protein